MEFTTLAESALRTMVGLYGAPETGPGESPLPPQIRSVSEDVQGSVGGTYALATGAQRVGVESQTSRDDFVRSVVRNAADATVTGRRVLASHLGEFQSRVQAIARIGDARFTVPALLDSATVLLASAGKQVTADVAAVQQRAAQIVPAVTPTRSLTARRVVRRKPRAVLRSDRTGRERRRRTSRADDVVGVRAANAADAWVGRAPYVWGGGGANGPTGGGFDCSGLTQYAIAQATNGEVILPRTTYDQINSGVRIHPSDVRPGDLVFPGSSFSGRGPEHVQLAVDGGVVEAPYTGARVRRSPMPSDAVVIRVL